MQRRLLLQALLMSAALTVSNWGVVAEASPRRHFIGTSTIASSDDDEAETECNFNGTAIPCGKFIWFTAKGKLKTPTLAPVTIYMLEQQIEFTSNGVEYELAPPDGATTFDPSATTAATTFTGGNSWATVVPHTASGNQFFAGFAWPVPCPGGLPGSIHPVSWSASFYADEPEVEIEWTWSAAVYTSFTTSYNSLGVKATDANIFLPYANSNPAGTPQNYTASVTGGATGEGGSNFTGSLCSTHGFDDLPVPARRMSWGALKLIYR